MIEKINRKIFTKCCICVSWIWLWLWYRRAPQCNPYFIHLEEGVLHISDDLSHKFCLHFWVRTDHYWSDLSFVASVYVMKAFPIVRECATSRFPITICSNLSYWAAAVHICRIIQVLVVKYQKSCVIKYQACFPAISFFWTNANFILYPKGNSFDQRMDLWSFFLCCRPVGDGWCC